MNQEELQQDAKTDEATDEELAEYGIDSLVWDGAAPGEGAHKTLGLLFRDLVNGERVEIDEKLIPNDAETHYAAIVVKPELEKRGIIDIHVETKQEPSRRSDIYLTVKNRPTPLKVVKPY